MPVIRPRLIVLACIALLLVAMIAVGVYGLLRGPAQNHGAGASVSLERSNASTGVEQRPAVLPKTDNPLLYARAVASALFDWSTTSGYGPADYAAPVLADADPSGQELPGLIEDIASYEPSGQQWIQLATMQVAQRLRISSAVVPSLWGEALAQAHGQLRRGSTAVTITGVRQRRGVWYGRPAASSSAVSFTIFELCTTTRCHTLRLSQLDNPLQ